MSTIRTRKNRQTGTMITVGRSDELGLNDGIGWALICEDHGTVMSMDTRKMADHHAPDPAGWCEVCAANVYGPVRMPTGEIYDARTDQIYQELELATIEADESTQSRNLDKNDGDAIGRCLLCENPVKNERSAKFVHVIHGGVTITTNPNPTDDPGDMYWLPIGPECYRKHRDTLRPFVEVV